MDDRLARLELLMQASAHLNETMLRSQNRIQLNNRRIDETNRLIQQDLAEAKELLQQILQTVAVLQADIVRIDETHTGPSAA